MVYQDERDKSRNDADKLLEMSHAINRFLEAIDDYTTPQEELGSTSCPSWKQLVNRMPTLKVEVLFKRLEEASNV